MAARPDYIIQTARIGLRSWQQKDLAPFAEMCADPEVMRYFPSTRTALETKDLVERQMQQQEQRGFCFWAADLLETSEFIGFIGLSYCAMEADFTPCVEIGWRLSKQFWGQGLATEGARACLDFAFDKLGLNVIYSFTPLNNRPSERVMQKIGMQRQGTFSHPKIESGHPLQEAHLYKIERRAGS